MAELPLTPPTREVVQPPFGAMPLGGSQTLEAGAAPAIRERMFDNRAGRFIMGTLGAGAVLAAGIMIGNNGNENLDASPVRADGTEQTTTTPESQKTSSEVCPEGIFSGNEPMALSNEVRPGDLHYRPAKTLDDDSAFMSYMFGKKDVERGVLCSLPTDIATFQAVFDSWVGGESGISKPFGDLMTDINELAAYYGNDIDAARKALDGDAFKAFINAMEVNKESISAGTYYELVLENGTVVQKAVDLEEILPGQVRTLGKKVFVNDMSYVGNGQMVFMDVKSGKVFVLKSLSNVPESTTTTSTTTTTSPEGSKDQSGTSDEQDSDKRGTSTKKKQAGGGSKSTSSNQGSSGQGGSGSGDCGTCGTGGGGNGGNGGTGGGGNGGTGGGGNGGSGSGGNGGNGGETPTTTVKPPKSTAPVTTLPTPTAPSDGGWG